MNINFDNASKPLFDRQLPVFNIYYPLQWDSDKGDIFGNAVEQFKIVDFSNIQSHALYFHFPFCETICNFCPFTRGKFSDPQIIDDYLTALIREIELKSIEIPFKKFLVKAIFVGGGTPSLLTSKQMHKFGNALNKFFDLSKLEEFSFECEVKSVTEEKVQALRDIGVTNARFGLQSFNPYWRDIFDLTATLEQIHKACDLFNKYIPQTSFDILYAMNGHSNEEFLEDLEKASNMGNNLIDVYPIDNVVTQIKLHKKLKSLGHQPLSADKRFEMNQNLRDFMHKKGFLPHNGHGYIRVSKEELERNPVITNSYSFKYHDHVYGHTNTSVIGFGVNAISILPQKILTNTNNRKEYINNIIKQDEIPKVLISNHTKAIEASRSIVTRLPYHGILEKNLVAWQHVPQNCLDALDDFKRAGLIIERKDAYHLTRKGWDWYINMIYYAMPESQKQVLDGFIIHNLGQSQREMTSEQITYTNLIS